MVSTQTHQHTTICYARVVLRVVGFSPANNETKPLVVVNFSINHNHVLSVKDIKRKAGASYFVVFAGARQRTTYGLAGVPLTGVPAPVAVCYALIHYPHT